MGGHYFSTPRSLASTPTGNSTSTPNTVSSPATSDPSTDGEGEAKNEELPPLSTPRLPPAVYVPLKEWITARLRTVFEHVAVYHEHPGKADYGDVDVVLCTTRSDALSNHQSATTNDETSLEQTMTLLAAHVLGAERFQHRQRDEFSFLAVKIPAGILALDPELDAEKTYVQVDLTFVHAPSQMDWAMAQGSYATFNYAMQFGLRLAGFVILKKGLYLAVSSSVIHEIAGYDCTDDGRKLPLVFLSNDLSKIFDLFGLDRRDYEENTFQTKEEYWRWVTSARFWTRTLICAWGQGKDVDVAADWGYAGRLPAWGEFVAFVRATPDVGAEALAEQADVWNVLDHFPGAKMRFFATVDRWVHKGKELRFWDTLRSALQDPKRTSSPITASKKLTQTLTAIKRFVALESRVGKPPRPVVVGSESVELDSDKGPGFARAGGEGGFTEEELLAWLLPRAANIRELDRARTRPGREEKRMRNWEAKAERKLEQAEDDEDEIGAHDTGVWKRIGLRHILGSNLWSALPSPLQIIWPWGWSR